MRFFIIILYLSLTIQGYALELVTSVDTSKTPNTSLSKTDSVVKKNDPSFPVLKQYNPLLATGCSALLPGAGLFVTGDPIKGGAYLAIGTIMGVFAYNRYTLSLWQGGYVRRWQDSIFIYTNLSRPNSTTAADSARFDTLITYSRLQSDLSRFDERESYLQAVHGLCWLSGLYLYGMADALESSHFFCSDSRKDPALAGWLSAIPGLGLGQIYNGAFGKAGMILMVQGTLGIMAYNNHELMRECERTVLRLQQIGTIENRFASQLSDDWQWRRNNAFSKRNSYLWYSLLFYFYGVFDAIVDAHLHDMPAVFKLEPDLKVFNANEQDDIQVGLKATVNLKN